MKKYILVSLLFHLSFFFVFNSINQLGNEKLSRIVPVTFVATKTSLNPGASVVAPREMEKIQQKKQEKKVEKKLEKEIEKKEIKSKVEDKTKKIENIPKEKTKNQEEYNETKKIESIENNGKLEGENQVFQGSNFIADGDGGYIALSSEGINYTILNEIEPDYPSQAEAIGYSIKVIVSVKFLVGLNGEINKIEIIKSHAKLGFDEEVKKAIKQWKFKPIYYHGKNIKVYFEKDFVFYPK